nr:hypothetical protein [Nesterenkonia lacusekhoensis]
MLRISRILVGVFMVIAVAWAPVILGFDTLVEYFQSFLGYVTMPIVVLVGGIFWKRATRQGAFWTLVAVTPLGLAGFLTGEVFGLHGVQFLYATGIMVVLSLISFATISLLTPAPDPATIQDAPSTSAHGLRSRSSSKANRGTRTTAGSPPVCWF